MGAGHPGREPTLCPSTANGQEMSMLASVIGFLQQESIHPTPLASSKQQRKAEGEAGEAETGGTHQGAEELQSAHGGYLLKEEAGTCPGNFI